MRLARRPRRMKTLRVKTIDIGQKPFFPDNKKQYFPPGVLTIKDNDSLAAHVAKETNADLAILMSNVDGIYDRPPSQEDAQVLHTVNCNDFAKIEFGEKVRRH